MAYKQRIRYEEVQRISKQYHKRGKLKGRNKTETKLLRDICTHHIYTKKGDKLKPTIIAKDSVILQCKICGARFSAKFKTKEERKEIFRNYREILDQLKYIAVAIGADKKTVSFLAQVTSNVTVTSKLSKKLFKIADKHSASKEKKHKKTYKQNQYGSWSVN